MELTSNKTIAKNTLLLYGRMLFNLVVSLYTSRVVLQVLGVSDLGIYQVVAGVVSMFTFMNGSLAGATSRFLAFELGRGDKDKLERTFAATLNVHILVSVFIFILCETAGLWLVAKKLVIPEERMNAALIAYQCAIAMTLLSVLQIPYNSSIIAHEKMNVFAYIGILDTLLKLLACYILFFTNSDRLIVYSFCLLGFSLIIQGLYFFYCRKHFHECHFRWTKDWEIAKPILKFSGWDLFGNFSLIIRNQGINIFINMFFGVVVNTACGFANTVYGAISGFINNFMTSIRPAITKAYSVNKFNRVNELIIISSKYAFSLLLLLSVPFFFEADFILKLWLKTPPEWTSIFCKLQLLTLLIAVSFFPIRFAISATGKNKGICIADSIILLSVLPVTYICFKIGLKPVIPYIIMIIAEILKSNLYPYLLRKNMKEFKSKSFYVHSISPCILMSCVVFLISFLVFELFDKDGWCRFLTMLIVPSIITCVSTFFYIMDKSMRVKLLLYIKSFL